MRLFTVFTKGESGTSRKRFNSRSRAVKYARSYLEGNLPRDVGEVLQKIPSDDGFLRVFRTVRACREDIQVDVVVVGVGV